MEKGKQNIQSQTRKSSYNVSKAYRGLSLTSIPGKVFERISEIRLREFIDNMGLLDIYQHAYQQDKSIQQALLFFTLHVTKANRNGDSTVTCYLDLEGAFDAIWRDGIIFQLHEAGLSGNLLLIVTSYLSDRVVRNNVNDYVSPWIATNVGVPLTTR